VATQLVKRATAQGVNSLLDLAESGGNRRDAALPEEPQAYDRLLPVCELGQAPRQRARRLHPIEALCYE